MVHCKPSEGGTLLLQRPRFSTLARFSPLTQRHEALRIPWRQQLAWTDRDIPNQSGRTVVITGANSGLGFENARSLAGAGAHVIMVARDAAKVESARAAISAEHPNAALEIVSMDLASLESVRLGAEAILAKHQRIDILINNAGVMAIPERRTADGIEMQLGVNHMAHFALTSHLMPALLSVDQARVVSVTSTAHHMGFAINPANPNLEGGYEAWRAYGQSKLANFHFGIGLARRFAAAGVSARSLIAHPGLSNTNLQTVSVEESGGDFLQKFFHSLAGSTGMTPAVGSRPQLRAAVDPNAANGSFYAPRFINFGAAVPRPIFRRIGLTKAVDTLWAVSEKMTDTRVEASR